MIKVSIKILEQVSKSPNLWHVIVDDICPDCGKPDHWEGNMSWAEVMQYRRSGDSCCYCESCSADRDEVLFATGY